MAAANQQIQKISNRARRLRHDHAQSDPSAWWSAAGPKTLRLDSRRQRALRLIDHLDHFIGAEPDMIPPEDFSHSTARHEYIVDTHAVRQPHTDPMNAHAKLGQTKHLCGNRRR